MMFIFGKVLDQLIHATSLKINLYAEAYVEPYVEPYVEQLHWSFFAKITKKLYCRCSVGF